MTQQSFSGIDLEGYGKLLKFAARLSKLFSDSPTPLIDYRFIEKAFVAVTKSRDLSRKDISFDASLPSGAGVGVKTFGFNPVAGHKIEKIAEFTKDAKNGVFAGLPAESLAYVVSDLRNARLMSDAAEVAIDMEKSFYHCLLRVPGGAVVHEEEMHLVSKDSIEPLSPQGKVLSQFPSANDDHVRFRDGVREYTFNRSKNTLMQRFRLGEGFSSEKIDLRIQEDIWNLLLAGGESAALVGNAPPVGEDEAVAEDSVVLPLYSTQSTIVKNVPEKSGINQWNAGGRQRSFGEAYIPIPRAIHNLKSDFFPPRDQKFELRLPSGEVISAKVCQDGSKALMSDPNVVLCNWLFATIDGAFSVAESRLARKKPYTYDDLARVGKDSVRVTKVSSQPPIYELESASIGSYEEFLAGEKAKEIE